ncbi:helix-turn-helix domain-containing protein [Polymorphobacter sp.]|uniref:helix-turn-helix domain-containing protein n=1 Tax=Polymorphobacter sp. TaxID=1909290 RepID=UPI003F719DE0
MLTRIRAVRKAKGLTLHDVAERCSPPTTAQTIGRLETGTRTVSVGWLNRIAAALGVETSELVTLPDRQDLDVAAVLGADGATAPRAPITLSPPRAGGNLIGMMVDVTQGDYRAGDELWLERLAPDDFARAVNRDVLVPRPVGRFGFGRLVATEAGKVQVLPLAPGTRQLVVDAGWLGVVRKLVRTF